jgi:hypothetical protein
MKEWHSTPTQTNSLRYEEPNQGTSPNEFLHAFGPQRLYLGLLLRAIPMVSEV